MRLGLTPSIVIAFLLAVATGCSSSSAASRSADAGAAPINPSGSDASSPAPDADSEDQSAASAPTRYPGSRIFLPPTTPAPAIVMLHGSEGIEDFPGSIGTFGGMLAKEGFVVLELCWWGCKDTPQIIQDVPLDHTIDAAQWLKGTKEVGGNKLGLFGWSRGGEQAVLVGASVKQTDLFTAIAAHAPSDTIVCAFDPNDEFRDVFDTDPATGQRVWAAAWTFHGTKLFGEKGMPFGSGPRIEVETYPGPMWISHGEADTLWPVDRSKHIVAARDKVAGLVTEAHYWAGEDHAVAGYTSADQKEWFRVLVAYFKAKIATP